MKRMVVAVVALAALTVPSVAASQTARATYFGALDGIPDSQVKFKESLDDKGQQITSFAMRSFQVVCDGGAVGTIRVAKLTGNIKVSNGGGFKTTNKDAGVTFKVKGKIKRGKAVGQVRFFGRIPNIDGATRQCDSGRMSWVAFP